MTPKRQSKYVGTKVTWYVMGLCAVLIGFAVAKEIDLISSDFAKRAIGVTIGTVLLVVGNLLPKVVLPLALRPQNCGSTTAVDRFAGRVFCIAGAAFMAVWLVAPLQYVKPVSSLIGIGAFLTVVAVWAQAKRQRPHQRHVNVSACSSSVATRHAVDSRGVILLVLNALFWVCAIFFIDSVWGDTAAQWSAVAFIIANGILVRYMIPKIGFGQ